MAIGATKTTVGTKIYYIYIYVGPGERQKKASKLLPPPGAYSETSANDNEFRKARFGSRV